jgi:ferredoxin
MSHTIKFSNGQSIVAPDNSNLSECSDITNSPVLYGCRTGICSTCLVNITKGIETLAPPKEDEIELLGIIAPDKPNARLACQFKLTGDLEIEYIGK